MSLYDAEKQITENLKLFGNPSSQPEKFNLYNALKNIIESLQNMEYKLLDIERDLRNIKNR